MVALLHPVGLLTVVDGDQLALYCVAYARWADAEKHIAEDGPIVKAPSGYPIQNPYLGISNAAAEQMTKHLSKFGMNPADRSRVQVGTTPAEATAATTGKARYFVVPAMRLAN